MKKITMLLATLFLVLSTLSISNVEASEQFSDLNGHGATKEIMYLYDKHIIGGYPDGTFKPNQPITRAQAAAMLLKALDINVIDKPTVKFKDVSSTSNYYKILATINEKGIIRGDDGYMRPGENATRAQMAAILRRAFDLPLDNQPTFTDVSPTNWASSDINSVAKNRIAGGYPDGSFKPSNTVTRAQFSTFLARALEDSLKLGAYKSYISKKGTTVEQDGWLYTIKDSKLVKINKKTKEEIVLLSQNDFEWTEGYAEMRLGNGFPIILYNDEIYIPFWSTIDSMTDFPFNYGLMKTTIKGGLKEDIGKRGGHLGQSVRNMYVWNDRLYYTAEQNNRYFDWDFNEKINIDDSLWLYSANLDGSNVIKEFSFDARVIFDTIANHYSQVQLKVDQNNKSVKYDHSTIYYFNKKGVYQYSLIDRKSTKLSTIQAKDMTVTDTGIIIEDVKGKKHILKK